MRTDTDEVTAPGNDSARFYHGTFIYTADADVTGLHRPAVTAGTVSNPAWSPDGTRIAFAKVEGDAVALYTIAVDGSDAQRVTMIEGWERQYREPDPRHAWIETVAWSPAGGQILYTCGQQICVVSVEGAPVGRSPIDVKRAPLAAWSPDGARIAVRGNAFEGNVGGNKFLRRVVLYTMAPDGRDVRILVVADAEVWGELFLVRSAVVRASRAEGGAGCGAAAAHASAGLVADCTALLALLEALDPNGELNWSADRPLAEWEGVVVDGSPPRVRELVLEERDLWGTIAPALGEVTQLQVLHLRANYLGGTIPRELSGLSQLREVVLSENYLVGTIPPTLGQLTNLQVLNVSGNQLTGTIPAELGRLARLERLSLNYNRLTDPIPEELGHLASLRELYLTGNQLMGCIPSALHGVRTSDLSGLRRPDC